MKIIVLEAPALHLGCLGCYGSEWATTPTLDRLAAEGVVFDQHFADCLDPAVRSSWSGRHALPLPGPTSNFALPGDRNLLDLLVAAGVPTRHLRPPEELALVEQWALVCDTALAALESMADSTHALVWIELPSLSPPWRVAAEDLEPWLPPATDDDEAVAPWLDPPLGKLAFLAEEDLTRLQVTAIALASLADTCLAALLQALEEDGQLAQALLCFTARTGLPLGEHGVIGPEQGRLHEELVHVPLLMRLPQLAHAGRRIPALTQPVDLMPTLLEALGVPVPGDVHGHSLWPLLRGEAEAVRPYACAGARSGDGVEWLLRTPEWACMLAAEAEAQPLLFLKPEDRWEVNNVVQQYQPWAAHLEQVLRAFVTAARQPSPLQAPVLQDLAAVLANSGETTELVT